MSEAFYEGLRPALEGGRLGEYLQEHWEDLGRDSMAFSAGGMWRGGTTLAWRIGLRILVEDAILEDMGITITNMGVADVPTEAIGGLIEGANSAHFFGE